MKANWQNRMEQERELSRQKAAQGMELPRAVQGQEQPGAAQQAPGKWHFLMETPDGEVMSVRQEDMSEYLKRYGTPVEQKKTESSPSSGEKR